MNIYSYVHELKGVGPKAEEALNKAGIYTILDLLLYFPRDYENIDLNIDLEDIDEKQKIALDCTLVEVKRDVRTQSRKTLTTLIFNYKGIKVRAVWFNQPYIKMTFKIGETYKLLGKYKKKSSELEIINPLNACKELDKTEIIPKYNLNSNLTNKILSKLIHGVLDKVLIKENLPLNLISKYNFISLNDAIREIHFPKDSVTLKKAKERLKFQELFTYSIKILMLKKHIKGNRRGIEFKISEELVLLKEKLPFSLTKAQSRVMREILIDEKKSSPMNRLVQGDVGSGKTIIAIIAIFNVIKNGYQGVFMAPTEILANQHYLEILKVLNGFNVEVELLTGSTKAKEKLRIKERIKNGDPIIVVGTHALIEDDVEFKKLGMIITDEQHRFGVHQRSRLMNKNEEADVLVMTATPIPRTLSLYLYSDLDISIIDELPPGRQKIDTVFYSEENRNLGYELALEEIKKGRQVYIVCPLIEENEDLKIKSVEETYEYLVEGLLKGIPIEILHGRMKPKEKDEIMKRFKDGETKVLISTTVIEVGVNVPNASVMIIENAERFGLSQLHQLRGRVGRGEYKSYCILIAKANNNVTKKRMQIMTMSGDGFYIAEQDLKIRGGGELFGFRQHGDNGLILSDFVEDIDILKAANKDAKLVVESDNMENLNVCKEIMNSLENTTKYICFN